ncbi:hypothetical protein [Rhodococcus jostii]|uniref:hypothetical protein n=1 Tax=Rhodococcus jostii TaxID=132919 RepID=UPI0013C3663D|nr:hypothetical protein [Rhodococcus jostii]
MVEVASRCGPYANHEGSGSDVFHGRWIYPRRREQAFGQGSSSAGSDDRELVAGELSDGVDARPAVQDVLILGVEIGDIFRSEPDARDEITPSVSMVATSACPLATAAALSAVLLTLMTSTSMPSLSKLLDTSGHDKERATGERRQLDRGAAVRRGQLRAVGAADDEGKHPGTGTREQRAVVADSSSVGEIGKWSVRVH